MNRWTSMLRLAARGHRDVSTVVNWLCLTTVGQCVDKPTRGPDNSETGHLAFWCKSN